ncbi:MAG: glutamate-5-semialdehyde dehydrogenase [Candidatus Coatesbacteria bacterium]
MATSAKMGTGSASLKAQVGAQAQAARQGALRLASVPTAQKNQALEFLAGALEREQAAILAENRLDVEAARKAGERPALIDRLTLTEGRLLALAASVREVVASSDPIGEVTGRWPRPNGLRIVRQRVPIGVIAIIYESRPNVTVDASVLCLKAGNAVVLKGGSESLNSNRLLAALLAKSLGQAGLPGEAVQFLDTTDHAAVSELVRLDGFVDLVIPRGSEEMIRRIREQATVPVIGHGKGLCHVFVDRSANLRMAEDIVFNAKVSRPGVCNAMECLLVHRDAAAAFLPAAAQRLAAAGVELRGDEAARNLVASMKPATDEDFRTEYLDLILSVKVVDGVDAAIEHINNYSSHLSEAIVSEDRRAVKRFMDQVDSAVVYHNASTRFTDGGEFGFGAEIGISTGRLHARGPMGLKELTSYKYLVYGQGQVRA